MRLLVLIPAHNEAQNLPHVLSEIFQTFPNADILVIDDASADNTAAVAAESGARVLRLPFNLGYAGALQTGFKYACAHDYDRVLQCDADGQHIAAEAVALLECNVDIAIGSRFLNKNDYHHPFFRKLGTAVFCFLIRLLCKQRITDPTSGFQILSRPVFTHYSKFTQYPDYPDANLLIEMLRSGYTVAECPVRMRPRLSGIGMHDGIWKPARYMLLMLYSILLVSLRPLRKGDKHG